MATMIEMVIGAWWVRVIGYLSGYGSNKIRLTFLGLVIGITLFLFMIIAAI